MKSYRHAGHQGPEICLRPLPHLQYKIRFLFCNSLGTADIDVSNKLSFESEGFPVQYSGDCPIIAYYNMATPR